MRAAIGLLCLASTAHAGTWSWMTEAWKTEQVRQATPTATRTVAVPAASPTGPATVAETPVPEVSGTWSAAPGTPGVVSHHPAPARVYLTDLHATPGGWAVTWIVQPGDLQDPTSPSELWYAHVGTPAVPARKLLDIHRIDREPVYLSTVSPDGTQVAVVVNELTNWKQLKRSGIGRVTHQWFGRLNIDGTWALPLQTKRPITTNLGTHGGVGDMVWTEGR